MLYRLEHPTIKEGTVSVCDNTFNIVNGIASVPPPYGRQLLESGWTNVKEHPANLFLDEENMTAETTDQKIDRLWNAANTFQSSQINGAAVGLVTLGLIGNKPRCKEVSNWITSIWNEYYKRKEEIIDGCDVDTDFTVFGNIPYTIPELMEEVGQG